MKVLLSLVFMVAATLVYADMRHSEDSVHLSVPGGPWELRFPKRGWELKQEHGRPDGRAYYYMFSNANTQVNASFFIVRDGYWVDMQ